MSRRIKAFFSFIQELGSLARRLMVGMWKLTRLPQPAITIFGSARLTLESEHSKEACALAKKLTDNGFSIITGGGPGIMEAANLGSYTASQARQTSPKSQGIATVGISLTNLNNEKANPYLQDNIILDHFFARKWLLIRYSVGFVVFPGGFGTADELFEILLLVQTNRRPNTPIVLMEKAYWQPLLDWMEKSALAHGMIDKQDLDIINVAETVEEALALLSNRCPSSLSCTINS